MGRRFGGTAHSSAGGFLAMQGEQLLVAGWTWLLVLSAHPGRGWTWCWARPGEAGRRNGLSWLESHWAGVSSGLNLAEPGLWLQLLQLRCCRESLEEGRILPCVL